MRLATTDPAALALASPIRTARAFANLGDAAISRGMVLDPTNAALLAPTQIVFNDPPTTYQVNGIGPLIPYASGSDIDANGWRVQITGNPRPGDSFSVQSNAGGYGDNSNGLAVAQLQFTPLLAGGTASYQEAYGILTGEVGANAQQAHISSEALGALTENAEATRDALAGVNLEEEAANLLRFQQAFQAAAQVIAAADAAFQSIINATRN
jgi:flagellar hook-associated protein 1 FlgK